MLLRMAATLGAIWFAIPRANTPRTPNPTGRFAPPEFDQAGLAYTGIESDDTGGLFYVSSEHTQPAKSLWDAAKQEEILALVWFLLLDPTTWAILFACSRALSHIGDKVSRIGRRNRVDKTKSNDDAQPLHTTSEYDLGDADNTVAPDETPRRKDTRLLELEREETPTPKPLEPAERVNSLPTTYTEVAQDPPTIIAPPPRTARHTIRTYLAQLLAPFSESSPAPLIPAKEAAQTLLREPDSVPLVLNTVGGPSTDQLASILGLGVSSLDPATVDLDAWTNEDQRSPTKNQIQTHLYGVDLEKMKDVTGFESSAPETDLLGIRLDGLFTHGLSLDRLSSAHHELNGTKPSESSPTSQATPRPQDTSTFVREAPPRYLALPKTPAEAREMTDLHSPFDDDDHSTPVSPSKKLQAENSEVLETDDKDREGSTSPFTMVGSRESIDSAPLSGSGLLSSGGTTPFSLVQSTELASRSGILSRRAAAPESQTPEGPVASQIFGIPASARPAVAPVHPSPTASKGFTVRLPPSTSAAPITAPPGQRVISGRGRFAAAPSITSIKVPPTMVIPQHEYVPEGRLDREDSAKRRYMPTRDEPVEPLPRIAPMHDEEDDESESDEEWSDDESDGEENHVSRPPPISAKPGVGRTNGHASGEQMVWLAQQQHPSVEGTSKSQSSAETKHIPFTAHLMGGASSPSAGRGMSLHAFQTTAPSVTFTPFASDGPVSSSFPVFNPTAASKLFSTFPAFTPPSSNASTTNSLATSAPLWSSFAGLPAASSSTPLMNPSGSTSFPAFTPTIASATSSTFTPPSSISTLSSTSSFPGTTASSAFTPPAPLSHGPEAYDEDFASDSEEEEEDEDDEDEDEEDLDEEGLPYGHPEDHDGIVEEEERHRPGLGFHGLSARNWTSADDGPDDGPNSDEKDQTLELSNGATNGNGHDSVALLEEEVQQRADAHDDDASMEDEVRAQFALAAGARPHSRGWRTPGEDVSDVVVSLAPEELHRSGEWELTSSTQWPADDAKDADADVKGSEEEVAMLHKVDIGEGHALDAVQEEEEPSSSPEQHTHDRAIHRDMMNDASTEEAKAQSPKLPETDQADQATDAPATVEASSPVTSASANSPPPTDDLASAEEYVAREDAPGMGHGGIACSKEPQADTEPQTTTSSQVDSSDVEPSQPDIQPTANEHSEGCPPATFDQERPSGEASDAPAASTTEQQDEPEASTELPSPAPEAMDDDAAPTIEVDETSQSVSDVAEDPPSAEADMPQVPAESVTEVTTDVAEDQDDGIVVDRADACASSAPAPVTEAPGAQVDAEDKVLDRDS
ncbi:hypothetical protein BKA62DRAFT_687048 [Auriculariales sp. MPI-PUGE-AT-0066]|nr:hypothetical protein BKA62DRAFT_687048 [Auriculariales sp. MPI-PUGE-AT-0066]